MNTVRKIKYLLGLCATSLMLFYSCKEIENKRPNVLMISIDDMNDWAGCLANFPNVKTPNIDRLASKGILFTNAHCQAPICAPSRASLLTGLQPYSTGLYYQFTDKNIRKSSDRAANSVFMPDYFEQHGYKSMGVGKIFHGGDQLKVFDQYGGIFPKMKFGPYLDERVNYDPSWFTHKRGTVTDWSPIDMDDSEMSDYKIAEWAVNKLDEQHDKPFFLCVGFVRPHVPWYVPKKWFDLFPLEDIKTPPYKPDDLDDVPEISRKLHEMPAMPKTEWLIKNQKWKSMIQAYLACMTFVDYQVGKVLDALENSSYADNTIIVLWSDHGYHLGEKNRTCKHSLWQRSTHVPLIFAGAGAKSGSKCNKAVGLIDIYPTLIDWCGLPEKKDMDGHDLMELVQHPEKEWPYPAMTSYGYMNVSLIKDNFHYIQYRDGSMELYDMDKDPNEWYNLVQVKEMKETIAKFKKMMPTKFEAISPYSIMNVNDYVDKELINAGIKVKH